jgi:hypothetical protein
MARRRRKGDTVLLTALACGATVESAARSANVSPATVYRRLNDPEFCRQLQEIRGDMVQRASGMLTASGLESVKTLLALQNESTPAAVRLGAARAVLEFGIKVREVADLERRLRALEDQLATAPGGVA